MLTANDRCRDFPSLEGMTYLNTAAEGIPPLAVAAALAEYFRDKQLGMDGRDAHYRRWEEAKSLVADMLGLGADEVSICSCSSEAYNLAALALRLKPGDEVVINDLDFPAGATPWLQQGSPASVKIWRSREGALRLEDLTPLLGPRTRLVTLSLVSFFNGFRIDEQAVLAAVRKHSSALVSLDVTQALGRLPMNLTGIDLIVSSTHKWILATHGGGLVGVPSCRAEELRVPAGGWHHLEDPFGAGRFERAVSRPGAASFTVGMPNFAAVYAIRAALDYLRGVGVEAIHRAAQPLLLACIGEVKKMPVELITPSRPENLAGIFAFRHPRAADIHRQLRERNIHVMSHAGRLRVAIHGYNTADDVERFLTALRQAL